MDLAAATAADTDTAAAAATWSVHTLKGAIHTQGSGTWVVHVYGDQEMEPK